MVHRFMLVHLVDGLGPVHHVGLYGFLLDDGLYMLVYVVVHVLSLHGWGCGPRVLGFANLSLVVVEAKGVGLLLQPFL